jgi:hypothetical protein
MRRWGARAAAVALALGLVASGQAGPAQAAPTRGWPVGPATLGSLYGTADPGGMASVRTWGSAIWCYLQPTPETDVRAKLDALVAPTLDAVAAAGGTAIVTIGHPAPWVFDNHPRAVAPTKLWACGDHASGVSIPSPASLKPNKDGTASVQARRWAEYVGTVVEWVKANYQGRLQVVLEVWNEPNLSSGLNYKLRIPGAARTMKQAVRALHTLESIAYDVIRAKGATGTVSLGSSALFTRPNKFSNLYLKYHNRKRRIEAIHVNVYGFKGSSANKMVADWDKRANSFRKRVRKYRKIRTLPIRVTEANLNLINRDGNATNLKASTANPDAQRRLATATQMNAYYRGFSSVYWLVPWRPEQTAVYVQTQPGNPARDALAVLQSALAGHTFVTCKQRKGLRTCTFKSPTGSRTKVLWRNKRTSKVRLSSRTEVLEMTGATTTLPRKARIKVGTTPIVLR